MLYTIDNKTNFFELKNKITAGDTLYFTKGIYQIKLSLNVPNLKIIGEDVDQTIITNADHYHKIMADYNECNTFRTYTLQLLGDNNTLENITIKNSCTSAKYGQAVALAVYGDNFKALNCKILGEQDTLFTGPLPADLKIRYNGFLEPSVIDKKQGRQLYQNCLIQGDVDFIFGGAAALFSNCQIKCLNDKGYVCAPSHAKDDKFGYLFANCQIETAKPRASFYLARPWRDYGLVYFINCNYTSGILEEGFNKWNDTNRDKTCRFYEYANKNYSRVPFVKKLSQDEADAYLKEFKNYLNI